MLLAATHLSWQNITHPYINIVVSPNYNGYKSCPTKAESSDYRASEVKKKGVKGFRLAGKLDKR